MLFEGLVMDEKKVALLTSVNKEYFSYLETLQTMSEEKSVLEIKLDNAIINGDLPKTQSLKAKIEKLETSRKEYNKESIIRLFGKESKKDGVKAGLCATVVPTGLYISYRYIFEDKGDIRNFAKALSEFVKSYAVEGIMSEADASHIMLDLMLCVNIKPQGKKSILENGFETKPLNYVKFQENMLQTLLRVVETNNIKVDNPEKVIARREAKRAKRQAKKEARKNSK